MSKMSDALFSPSTKAILASVFTRPDGMHLRALMQLTGLGSASAQRELGKLSDAGLLVKVAVGKVILYKANKTSPIYAELSAIIRKTEGVEQALKTVLMPFRGYIERAFIYGSVAKQQDTASSDIDVLVVVNEIGSADLYPKLIDVEQQLGRKISLTVYRPAEYQRKLESNHHFLAAILAGPIIELIGEKDEQ